MMCLLVTAGVSASSSEISLEDLQTGFESFAAGVANTLGSASTTGLNWSSAYIGQFPHLGVGLTVGAALIPYANMQPILETFGVTDIPAEFSFLETYGIPPPAVTADARIGGFILPFDIGLKLGFIPDQLKEYMVGVNMDYLMFGADFRLALMDGKGWKPAISVGVGYSYYRGSIAVPDVMGTGDLMSMDVTDYAVAAGYPSDTYTLAMSGPELMFDWESSVIEAKIQVSKKLLFITPSVGVSAAKAFSTAGGGILSTLTMKNGAGVEQDMTDLVTLLDQLGLPAPTDQGVTVSSEAGGWAFTAFGGVSVNLFFLYVDTFVNYNLLSGSYGGSVNLRVQF